MNSVACLLCLFVIIAALDAGMALHCFVCDTSPSDPNRAACADPFKEEDAKALGLLKDCGNLPEDVGLPTKNYTFCRKYTQDVEGDYRISRSCATAGRPGKCIDRTGTAKIKLQYCECDNTSPDKPCNFAPQSVATGRVVLGLATVGVVLSALLFH